MRSRPSESEDKVDFISIEKLKNGFLVIVPERGSLNSEKFFKATTNGLCDFIEKTFEVPRIKIPVREEPKKQMAKKKAIKK